MSEAYLLVRRTSSFRNSFLNPLKVMCKIYRSSYLFTTEPSLGAIYAMSEV